MSKTNLFELELMKHIFWNDDITGIGDAGGLRGSTASGSLYMMFDASIYIGAGSGWWDYMYENTPFAEFNGSSYQGNSWTVTNSRPAMARNRSVFSIETTTTELTQVRPMIDTYATHSLVWEHTYGGLVAQTYHWNRAGIGTAATGGELLYSWNIPTITVTTTILNTFNNTATRYVGMPAFGLVIGEY